MEPIDDEARAAAIRAIETFEEVLWSERRPAWEVPRETRSEWLKARADLIRAILALVPDPTLPRVVVRGSYAYIVYCEQEGAVNLFDDLAARRVNLVSLRDGLDLSTPGVRLMANVLASMAAYETEIRAERIQAGLEVARAKGVHLGRRKGDGKGVRLKVTPEQEAVARRLRAEGQGVSAIARATGLSRPTIYSIITPAGGPS